MIECRSPLCALGILLCASATATAGCSAPPARPTPPPIHPAATATASAALDPAPPAPAKMLDWKAIAASVAHAYELRASGDVDGARAAFRDLVTELLAAGASKIAGLDDIDGDIVLGRKMAGFSARVAPAGTWFFDAATGEPSSFAPGVGLRRGAPPLDEPYFAVTDSAGMVLFDRSRSSYPDLPGYLIALHPDGHRIYLLGEDCQLREWSLAAAQVTRALDAHYKPSATTESGSRMECDGHGFRDAAVTADGKWLTTRFGRWDLTTGRRRKLPFYWDADSFFPAVSLDGRYVAQIAPNPRAPKESYAEVSLLVLHDLDTGKSITARDKLGVLSNGDPLSFGASPARVCIFDYGFHAFAVPSLRRFEPGDAALLPDEKPLHFGPDSCETKFVRPPPDHPEILARLASRVCAVGGFLVPVDYCKYSDQ